MAKYEDMYLFEARCGHRWVGSQCGWWACPVCGLYDGDHHLTVFKPIAVQANGGATLWQKLAADSEEWSKS